LNPAGVLSTRLILNNSTVLGDEIIDVGVYRW